MAAARAPAADCSMDTPISDGTGPGRDLTPPPLPGTTRGQRLEIRFTGSGSEYLRIWIVNLLLTIVTLTLYHPWAKARRLRYFHANTHVGGHALGFHGEPRQMLRGYLLIGVLLLLYSAAGKLSPLAGIGAFLLIAAIWPALLKSSMQFRLANTSWRGLRFRFTGSVGGAYRALLPLLLPGLLVIASAFGLEDEPDAPTWYVIFALVATFGSVASVPWLWWNLKRYQHDHYALGTWRTTLSASRASFYAVFLKTLGVAVASLALVGGVGMVLGGVGLVRTGRGSLLGAAVALLIGMLALFVALLAVQIAPRPYFTSRMQNLLWSTTGGPELQFHSDLRFLPLFGLTLKNWGLIALTLGLYWPFAAVATARMQLEALSITAHADPDTLVAAGQATPGDAAGDAAGDLLGFDIGL